MRRDTFGFLCVAIFAMPFTFGLCLGTRMDFERVCVMDRECGVEGMCLQGACVLKRRCSWAAAGQLDCGSGSSCDIDKGHCYQDAYRYSGWVWFHPGYYTYRSQRRLLLGGRVTVMPTRQGGRTVMRYRVQGTRGFRGGGLGFGK
jgi:hypothetical protein